MSALSFQLLKLWPSARDFDAEQTKLIENPIPFGCGLRVVSNFWKKEDKSGEKHASLAQGAPNLLGAPCVSSANSKLCF